MTVALVCERKDLEAVEVAFSESARFYKLLRANSQFERIRKELCQAKENKLLVRVPMASGDTSASEDVEGPS